MRNGVSIAETGAEWWHGFFFRWQTPEASVLIGHTTPHVHKQLLVLGRPWNRETMQSIEGF